MVNHENDGGAGGGFEGVEPETLNLFQFCQDAHYSCYKSPVLKHKRKEKRGHENSPGGLSSILVPPPHARKTWRSGKLTNIMVLQLRAQNL